jgi:hypothetical protein
MRVSRPCIAPPVVSETQCEMNHRPGGRLSAGSQIELPTVRFSSATTVSFTAAANTASNQDEARRAPEAAGRFEGASVGSADR